MAHGVSLATLRALPPDVQLVLRVDQVLRLVEEAGRDTVVRWIKVAVASQVTGIPESTLRARCVRWFKQQEEGKTPAVRVQRLSANRKSDWLLDEGDVAALPKHSRSQALTALPEEDRCVSADPFASLARQVRGLARNP